MNIRFGRITGALLLVVLCATPLAAHETEAGALRVEHAWARATAGMAKVGAAYLTVTNDGAEMDRLIGATSSVAAKAELHSVVMQDNVMKMRQIEAIEVHPGEPFVLRPGGVHVMLMGLKRPLKEGETFPLLLTFERSGPVEVTVVVHKAGSMGHDMEHHDKPMQMH
jgi:copper(I)-binding protein